MDGAHHTFSYEDYLRIEDESGLKHEFANGSVWAMAGGSPRQAAVAMNIGAWLSSALRGRPCQVFSADLRVHVEETNLTTYPDITVVCGPLGTYGRDPAGHTVTNPVLLVEVLSPSTEAYDRGDKLAQYKRIPSLQEVLLVDHDARRIERWHRAESTWTLEVAHGEGRLSLALTDEPMPLAEVFRDPLA